MHNAHPQPTRISLLRHGLLLTLALTATLLHAQSLAGRWQGTLPSGANPRVVFELAGPSTGPLTGSLIFIDRGGKGAPLLSATFIPPILTLAVGDITFQGKLSPDARTLAGTYTQGDRAVPLTLTLATPETAWTYTGPAALPPMPAGANPVFEVATIKPSRPDAHGSGISSRAHIFRATNTTVAGLVEYAYRLRDRQLQNAPSWAGDLHFDISAEPDIPGQPNPDQARAMVRKLLADRFSLQFHTTHPVTAVYALTRAPHAPELIPSKPGENGYMSIYVHDGPDNITAVQFVWTSMADFLDTLMNFLPDRQIVDNTGLRGQFDFTLSLPTGALHGEKGPDVPDTPTAFREALPRAGFKLTPARQPLEVLVVDRLEKPSPN